MENNQVMQEQLIGEGVGFERISERLRQLEESQAGLKALTGLDDGSIAWLTEQARLLSTQMTDSGVRIRQSSQEILEAFQLVGSAKPELLEDGWSRRLQSVGSGRFFSVPCRPPRP